MCDQSFYLKSEYTPQHIANYFLKKSFKEKIPITNFKLNLLVYISLGYGLAKGTNLFREPVEAWTYRPVIPVIFHDFKDFGGKPITCLVKKRETWLDYEEKEGKEDADTPEVDPDDKNVLALLEAVWEKYKDFSLQDLKNKTNKKNTPWEKTKNKHLHSVKISKEQIREHYKILLENESNQEFREKIKNIKFNSDTNY
jgi:uncharacterized phage-associated protein